MHAQVGELDKDKRWVRALDGTEYMPGLVGLNNMKANDYVNAIVQARPEGLYSNWRRWPQRFQHYQHTCSACEERGEPED